ncbi:hypothetical protein TSMEX_011216 [Taenia solium]|eukprot:TsM_000982500 transcript=TsM_000982500 gene=TsM_000982500
MRIVHSDVKPTTILIADSGHLLISDFDRSYDMTRATRPPRNTGFNRAPFSMAPEVSHEVGIKTKAGVRSLGVLVTTIMYGHVRVKACLTSDHKRHLDIDGVKCLDFYKDVNWEEVVACKMEPPYHPSEFKISAAVEDFNLDPHDPLLLTASYSTHMPLIDKGLGDIRDKNGVRQLVEV